MINARFITENYLKSLTAISGNVDVSDLLPFVDVSQDIEIQEILGSKLYNSLMAAVAASTVTTEQTALLMQIRPAQAYYTFYRALPFLQTKVRNKGVLAGEAEAAKTIDDDRIKWLRNEVKGLAEFYATRLQDFLCKNNNDYPDFTSPDYPMGPNSHVGYECDLVFDEECGCNNPYYDEPRFSRYFWQKYLA